MAEDKDEATSVQCCVYNPSEDIYDDCFLLFCGCSGIGFTIFGVLMLVLFIILRFCNVQKVPLKDDIFFLFSVVYICSGLFSWLVLFVCQHDFPWLSRFIRRIFSCDESAQIHPAATNPQLPNDYSLP